MEVTIAKKQHLKAGTNYSIEKMVTALDIKSENFLRCDINDRVSSLIGKMDHANECIVVVFDGPKYLGVVTKTAFMVSRENAKETKVNNLLKKRSKAKTQFFVPKLKPTDSLSRICRQMVAGQSFLLPIFDRDKFIGVVRGEEVLNIIQNEYTNIPAFELARMEIRTIKESDSLHTALSAMKKNNADYLPVVDSRGNLSGIVSGHDYIMLHLKVPKRMRISGKTSHGLFKNAGFDTGEKTSISNLRVSEIMSTDCCTSTPRNSVKNIISLMLNHEVFSVVLVKRNKPVGLLTAREIFIDASKH